MMTPEPKRDTAPQPAAQNRIPDQLNQAMVVIDMKTWFALGTVLLVLLAVLVWAFFGTMALKQAAQGVLIKAGRTITLYAPEDKVLLDLAIQRDQMVAKDQVVARLDQPELVEHITQLIASGAGEAELEAARQELLRRSQVISFEGGRVKDIYVHAGDYLAKGQRIATLLQSPPKGQNITCRLYVPMDQAHGIKKGMTVNVYPDFADKNTYGNMVGTVADISEYPVSDNYLLDALGSAELAMGLTGGMSCFELTISLKTSADTPTGYYWTTSKGPSIQMSDLSMVTADVVLSTQRPIDVFFLNK